MNKRSSLTLLTVLLFVFAPLTAWAAIALGYALSIWVHLLINVPAAA